MCGIAHVKTVDISIDVPVHRCVISETDDGVWVQFLGDISTPMAWAMQTVGWVEVGDMLKADNHLRKQLAFIRNNFQVSQPFPLNTALLWHRAVCVCSDTVLFVCALIQCCLCVFWHSAVCVCSDTVLFVCVLWHSAVCVCSDTVLFACAVRPVFSASHVQHISNLHSTFTLRPHHVWRYGRHPICDRWD